LNEAVRYLAPCDRYPDLSEASSGALHNRAKGKSPTVGSPTTGPVTSVEAELACHRWSYNVGEDGSSQMQFQRFADKENV